MDRLNTLWFMFWVRSASPPDDYNASSHSSLIVTKFLAKHETKVIAQPPYSPDLALCDFFLFPKLKYPLRGTRHESIKGIKRNFLKELKAIIKICIKTHKNFIITNQSGSNLIRWYITNWLFLTTLS